MSRERPSPMEEYSHQETPREDEIKKQAEQILWNQKNTIEQEVGELKDGILDDSTLKNIQTHLEAWLQNLVEITPDQEQNAKKVSAWLSRAKTKKNIEDILSCFKHTEKTQVNGEPTATEGEKDDHRSKVVEGYRKALDGMRMNIESMQETLGNKKITRDYFLEELAGTYGQLLDMSDRMPEELSTEAETLVGNIKKECENLGVTEFTLPQKGTVVTNEDLLENKYSPTLNTTDDETMRAIKNQGKENFQIVIDGISSVGYKGSDGRQFPAKVVIKWQKKRL